MRKEGHGVQGRQVKVEEVLKNARKGEGNGNTGL